MLCDGRFVCGCADPVRPSRARRCAARRRSATSGPDRSSPALRQDLNGGGSKFCGDCPLKLPLKKDQTPTVRPLDAGPMPRRMFIECTAACNISCTEACCAPETGITRTRQAGMLDFDLFRARHRRSRPVARPHRLLQLRRSVPAQARDRDVRVHQVATFRTSISTRAPTAWRFTEEQARRLVHSGIDEVTFSIDGATQASYEKYRQRGKLDVALAQPPRDGRREAADRTRPAVPELALHPVRVERQRRGDGRARGSSPPDIGVDRLCWEITDHPEDAFSRRFVPGSAGVRAHPPRDLGRQQPRATPSPARRRARKSTSGPPCPGCRSSPRGDRGADGQDARSTTCRRAVSGQRHLRPAAGAARRAALLRRRRR